jgi:flagellar hook-associated protein 3 FlgL
MFETGAARISDLTSTLQRTQQQLSSNRRVFTPSDDPVAAAQALEVTQAQAVNAQYAVNRQNAKNSLSQEEAALGNAGQVLQDIRTLVVSAGNTGTLTNADRVTIADQLSRSMDQLLVHANAGDGTGNYLFSGYQTPVIPFTQTTTGATYNGDQGQRMMQVGAGRQIALSDAGDAVFNAIKTIATAAAGTNAGSASISTATVTDATALNGHLYSVDITGAGATYSVFDLTLDPTKVGVPLATGAYPTTQPISFGGMQFDITGPVVAGDSFTATPLNNQSIFKTITDIINVLKTPGTTTLSAGVATALGNIDQGFNNTLTVRASVGSRLAEVDALDSIGSDRDLQYSSRLSSLQDLDYAKAISEFTMQQTTLQAAQKSFISISELSLFKLL